MTEGEYFPKPQGLEREKALGVPYEVIARAAGLSSHRLRRLLNTGKVEGEKLRKKGKGFPWHWVTTQQAVERYQASLKTPREYGMMGGRPRKTAQAA